MEYGSIEREIHVDAAPEVVYEVVSTPEHLRGWWPDDAEFEPVAGGTGTLSFGDSSSPDAHVDLMTVVEADPPRRFSFRWVYDEGVTARQDNSLLVTFDLVPTDTGTLLRMTETGFRERGWEAAVLEERYRDHVTGWDYYLPRLAPYVAKLVSAP
jgi:uncharacterized protein YndB with AHSA1/START domain